MKDFFNGLLEYNRHMNNELIRTIVQNRNTVSEQSVKLMNHILNVQEIFNIRISDGGQEPGSWNMRELDELATINENNFQVTSGIVRHNELDKIIDYKTAKGAPVKHSIQDIVFHVINHSTYHRAQIATDFRNTGLEPLITDYVVYKR